VNLWSRIRSLWKNLTGKPELEKDLDDELRAYVEMTAEEKVAVGISPADARRLALIECGGIEQVKGAVRAERSGHGLEILLQDTLYGLRLLRRSPGFTIVAVITLALGIGANTAIFSIVDAFLLRLLPVKQPEQLVLVCRVLPKGEIDGDFTYQVFEQFRDRNRSFSGIFAYDDSEVIVGVDGQSEMVDADFVSGSYFDVLGTGAIVGRTFRVQDDQVGKTPVAVISYDYWKRRFAQNPSLVGKTIDLAGIPFSVIGVTKPGFFGRHVAGRSADIVLPMFVHAGLALKDHNTFQLMARLRPGVTREQATEDLDVIYHQALLQAAGSQISSQVEREIHAERLELKPGMRGTSETSDRFAVEVRILLAVVCIALLIAAVNVANLLLVRAAARRREIGVRLAIGASRARVIRQLLTESVLLAAIGGSLGLLFAKWGVGIILTVLSYGRESIPFDLHPDLRILAFTGAVSLLTGVLFGLAPALTATRVDVNRVLKGTEASTGSHLVDRIVAKSFVISQVALSLVLLIGAGLLLRTLERLYAVDTGFEREKVLLMWIFPVLTGYDHAREMRLYQELQEHLNEIPGVESASLSRYRLTTSRPFRKVRMQDPSPESNDTDQVFCGPVGPRFFATMGIRLLSGREFSPADTETAPKVAVISQSMARTYFQNANPIGKYFAFEGSPALVKIVGVVKDIQRHPWERGPHTAVYIPVMQAPVDDLGQMNLVVRTRAKPASVIASIRSRVQAVDKHLPVVGVQTQEQEIDDNLGGQRSLATFLSFFGALALVLASIGLYGTMSYTVERRTKELGIRMALGAEKKDLLQMVLRETATLVGMGVAIGVVVAMAATRLIASMLFDVKTTDAATISVAIFAMFAIALLAGYIPARRATKVDPTVILRYE
jgi:predicted permease